MLANAIRAENTFVNALRQEQQNSQQKQLQIAQQQQQKEAKAKEEKSTEKVEKQENKNTSREDDRAGTSSTAQSEPIRRQVKPKAMKVPRRASTLPPVEILAEHMGRASKGSTASAGE